MNTEKIKQEWQQRGFSFDIWEDPPGQVWTDYVHDVDELFILAEGEVSITMNGKTIQAVIGEEILIPASVKHTVCTSEKNGSRWYYGYRKA